MAAAREGRSSLLKMLLRCRSTVLSLMKSWEAICRLVLPAATSRSTWISRALRPPSAGSDGPAERFHTGKVRARAKLLKDPTDGVELTGKGAELETRATIAGEIVAFANM